MVGADRRMARERRTVEAMILLYCHANHGTRDGLCEECEALRAYAGQRLDKCPFQEAKSTCANCAIHCYKPEMREHVRVVMRYAGPRMIYRHPVLALLHMFDGRIKARGRGARPSTDPRRARRADRT